MQKQYPIMIGHTRLATQGAVTKENAHPFRRGNIVGVHNGSVANYREISPNAKVDSEAIFDLLSKYDNDYVKAFKELTGGFAIAWSEINNKGYSIHLVSSGNPLHLTYLTELDTVFFASTAHAIRDTLKINKIVSEVFFMPTDKVLTIDQRIEESYIDVEFGDYETYYSKNSFRYGKESYSLEDEYGGWCQMCSRFEEECICDEEEKRNRIPCELCLETLGAFGWNCIVDDQMMVICGECKDRQNLKGERLTAEEARLYSIYGSGDAINEGEIVDTA